MRTYILYVHIFIYFVRKTFYNKIWNAAIIFVTYVRLYVRKEQLGLHWTDFHEI